jgi:cytochrome c oxidase subunit 1
MSEALGKIHFIGSFLTINGIFFPMFIQGLHGVNRRLYDGGVQYAHVQPVLHWNQFMSYAAWGLMLFQVPFIFNFFWSIFKGKPVGSNPWHATTLDWTATTSPPLAHGNFETTPQVYHGPYEYSLPGRSQDFLPQNQKD